MIYDTRRDNHFTRTVGLALPRMGLTSLWEGKNVDHTHVHTDGLKTSIIDHFLVSHPLLGLVEDCGPQVEDCSPQGRQSFAPLTDPL